MISFVQQLLFALLLATAVAGTSACTARQGSVDTSPSSIERPAHSIGSEKDALDVAGEIAVILLAIGSLAAGIVLPILLFL